MTTIEQVQQLHTAFCDVTARELPLTYAAQRWWYEAAKEGVTTDMVRDVMTHRMKQQYGSESMRFHSLSLRYLIGSDERIASLVEDYAQIAANRRKRVFTPGKSEALRSTGRADEPEQMPARHITEIFNQMREKTA